MADITDRQLRNLKSGKIRVARCLYFIARPGRRPYWEFRYVSPTTGKRPNMTLGQYPDLGLAAALDRARECRQQVSDGIDPREARDAEREAQRRARESSLTLREAARDYHELMRPSWRDDKHAQQWMNSLEHLGELLDREVDVIAAADLLEPLEELNKHRHETAIRVRQRVDAIYERLMLAGRVQQNPARSLVRALSVGNAKKKRNFAAIDYRELPAFIERLRDSDAAQSTRLGFEWLILAAARTREVRLATWSQIENDRWAPPNDEANNKRRAGCPLTWRMREILEAMKLQRGAEWDWIFPSPQSRRKPLSDGAFLRVIDRLGFRGKITAHGMRAAFSTWAYETQAIRPDVIEAALGHTERNAVKAAYSRANYWADRVELAIAWTDHCCTQDRGDKG